MADYYPLLSRAVRNLPNNGPEARQAIFLRARDALERQLRSMTPRLTDADIIRELLSLEDVIKRIERELEEEAQSAGDSLRRVEEAAAALKSETTLEDAAPALPAASASPAPGRPDSGKITTRPRARFAPVSEGGAADAPPKPAAMPEPEPPRPVFVDDPLPQTEKPEDEGAAAPRIRMPTDQDAARKKRRLGIFAVAGVVAIVAMGAIALFTRDTNLRQSTIAEAVPQAAPAIDPSKQENRLPAGDQAPAAPSDVPQNKVTSVPIQAPAAPGGPVAEQPPLPVVSRAFMVLEVPGRSPNQYEGQASWSFSPDPNGRSPEKALRAVVEFAGAGLGFDVVIARAADPSLNASHIATLNFTPNPGMSAVREMGALEWREREGQPGLALAGTLVPIQDNLFMIGLDATPAGRARNLEMMRAQRWMVFEIKLADNRRGGFLVEKGSSGDKAIAEALDAWR